MAASREQVASLYADVGMNVTKAQQGARDMSSRLLTLQNQFKTVRDQAKVTSSGIQQAFALGAGIGAGIGAAGAAIQAFGSVLEGIVHPMTAAVESIADYDKQMNTFKFLTGASAETMAQAATAAKALGTDLKLPQYSAADAAEAMLDLAKAGISAQDAIAGARPALLLAAAGEASAADAATLLANTLNEFNLKGTDAGRIADEITAAMKHSGQSLGEMSDALAQGGATFKQANQPLDTFLTLVAELGKAGIRGSQAGNTLNQMMQSMIAPTDEARGMMYALGVHVYDTQNKMRPFRDILKDMTPALQRLTEAQRNAYLSTIFGSNAVRAASIIFGQGTDAFDAMAASLTEVGTAEGLAGAKADSLAGALADIKKEFNTAIFSAIEPYKDEIKGAAQQIGGFLQDIVKLTQGLGKSEIGLMGLATAFAALGAASIATGDLGGGLEYILIAVLLIVNQIVKAFSDLIGLVGKIGDVLDRVFGGKGGGGGLGGGVALTVTPVLSDDSRGAVQREIDSWPALTKAIVFSIPGIGAVVALIDAWPALSKVLNLIPSPREAVDAVLAGWPSFVKQLVLQLPGISAVQAVIDTWNLIARLTLNPEQKPTQDKVDQWYLDGALDLKPDNDETQKKVDRWYLDSALDLDPNQGKTQTKIDDWEAMVGKLDLQPDRDSTQAKVDPWYLDHPIDLNPDRRITQGKIDDWPLLTAYGSLDLSRAEAQAKISGWALLETPTTIDLPDKSEVQRLIDVAFPDLKLKVQIDPQGGSPYPKGVEPPQPTTPTKPAGAIAGPDSQGRYQYPVTHVTPYGTSIDYEWRAKGGPVDAGKPYIVGEQGPEPFIPSSSGTILPNSALGGDTYIVNVYGDGYGADIEDRVVTALKTARQKGRVS